MSENSEQYSAGSTEDTGQFFSVGAPLHAVRPGYVRRPADDQLFQALVSGAYAHVIAPDRTGKSSLIAATSARLQNNGFKVAIIDLAQISERDGGADAARWYYSIAYRLLRQLRLKIDLQAWWQDKSFLSNRQRLVEFYVEVVLQYVSERVVIFVDEVQYVASLPFATQLLASIRAAHNARVTEPDFTRLSFVLVGECDPASLVEDTNLSPFVITRSIQLGDFTRSDLDLFENELNLSATDARAALDRIFHWTRGQPYLSQKLARAVARERVAGNVEDHVDRIAIQQLAGRAAIGNEPHMAHIHKSITGDRKHGEALLNLYGRIRKGVATEVDLGSSLQRRLIAVGLIVVASNGLLEIRNPLYESVFTARWANENLPMHWRGPAIAVAMLLAFIAVPFWYTQLLPRSYVAVMSSPVTDIDTARSAYSSLRSFPGHADSADRLFRVFLRNRAAAAVDLAGINQIDAVARSLPDGNAFSDQLVAAFWDRQVAAATRIEDRDAALLAALESLLVSTPSRRRRAATLVGDDYTQLIATQFLPEADHVVFSPDHLLLTYAIGPQISQWSVSDQGLASREPWIMSALEVSPLVRRVAVNREGQVRRIGLTINISHARLDDLRLKLTAPSGRTVDLTFSEPQSSANDVIRFDRSHLSPLIGEPLSGTWSLSVRDETTGTAGHLIAWDLNLNSQVLVEDFERGLDIPEPVARDSDDLWFSPDGRYAIARAMQSDSARLWDLALAQPARTIAVPANERVLGLSTNARFLLTITHDAINLWNTATGKLHGSLPVGTASAEAEVSGNGEYVLVRRRGDADMEFALWSIESAQLESSLKIAGSPALVTMDAGGNRLAVADYDRAIRIWDFRDARLVSQLHFWAQPSAMQLAANGTVLGVIHGDEGISMWRVDQPELPLLFERGQDDWQLAFSQSGARVLAGSTRRGFQVFRSSDGALSGSPLAAGEGAAASNILAFSSDEKIILTGDITERVRFWAAPAEPLVANDGPRTDASVGHRLWRDSGDSVTAISPGGKYLAIGDNGGHVHVLHVDATAEDVAAANEELSFLGHRGAIDVLSFSHDGDLVASAGFDSAIRVWETQSGLPRPFSVRISASAVDRMDFSPSGSRLAILAGRRLWVVDTDNGTMLAEIELGDLHHGLEFAFDDHVYVGGASGTLRMLASDRTGSWHLRTVWQGSAAIREIELSPNEKQLVMVDSTHLAKVLNLETGSIGASSLQLSDTVTDVLFSPNEARALFRTSRWVHRAGISPGGLIWLDAIRAPKALAGSTMVFEQNGDAFGDRIMLLTRHAGFPEIAELRFSYSSGPALFGNKDELIAEWRNKLGVAPSAPD